MDTLYLVDGSNFLFRAYHALPTMNSSAGVPTGAVFGFANMLLRLLDEHHPTHLAVVFDAGGESARKELYADYKANRSECPEDLRPQFDLTRRLVRAMGLCCLDATTVEADDLIATLARQARDAGLRVVIVSSDKDLMQLVGEDLTLLDTMKERQSYGPAQVAEKFGVPPAQLGDVLALMGDSSDNVPGVPGVGPKTAAQLIGQFGSLDALFQHLDDIKGRGADRIKALLREHEAQVRLSRRLVALDEQVETPIGLADLRRREFDAAALEGLLAELEFNRLRARFLGKAPAVPPIPQGEGPGVREEPAPPAPGAAAELLPANILSSEADLTAWVAAALPQARECGLALAVALAGHGGQGARVAPACGLALFVPGLPPVYLPLGHRYLGAPEPLPRAALQALAPLFADPAVPKLVYGAKDAHLACQALGLTLLGIRTDPALCSYLLDPAVDHTLPALARRVLGLGLQAREELCQGPRRSVPLDALEVATVAKFAGREAQAIHRLSGALLGRLDLQAQALLHELELPLSRVLSVIECHGVLLDSAVLNRLSAEVSGKLAALEEEIQKEAGYEVNIGSPKQLQELLFEKLQLPPVKKTKTGYSTDAEVLETLAADYPIARRIHEHRGLAKLKSTYIDLLPQLVDPKTGRLHTSYSQVVAATGRLSSTEPNLQNVPIRTELGRQIRRAFIAPPGHVLITADYSQIELRVLAHLSGDPLLCESFRSGEDVHERTAIEMFGPETGRRPESRRAAKMINYGIVYGLSDYGLAVRLSIERTVARSYIKEYFARYARVHAYMNQLVEDARRAGGARTLLGRFRPLPDIATRNYQARAAAERMAKNTPIQGTAADILKRAMIDVQARLDGHPEARMLLTVHDELVLEARAEDRDAVMALVKEAMERAFALDVPLQVDVGAGANWADCD